MARIAKEEEFNTRRGEILDAAQVLIYTKGYEQMTIQDILQALNISKGAFYHYFNSKQALLEAMIERTTNEAIAIMQPIIDHPRLSAVEKFRQFFDAAGRWKTDRKEFFLALLRVWYMDENAIFREKTQVAGLRKIAPQLASIIQQGIDEGTFQSDYPEQISEVVMTMMVSQASAFGRMLLESEPGPELYERARSKLAVYNEAMERALCAPPGSLRLLDDETLREWADRPRDRAQATLERD